MRLTRACALMVLVFMAVGLHADSRNIADYPLRLHIFSKNQTTFWHREYVDEAKGTGRANLFENGEAHGVDFSYECSDKVRASFGFETYAARWKKPGKELRVLFPVFGKTGQYFTCDLKTDVKDFAYTRGRDGMGMESVADFKRWMVSHDYDPEHGKDVPSRPAGAPGGAAPGPPPTE